MDRSLNANEYDTYHTLLQTGEASILFLDPWLYNEMPDGYLYPVSSVLGDIKPDGLMEDGCGVRLGDTAIYATYPALQVLPADTVVCLQTPLITEKAAKKNAEKLFEIEKSMFAAFLTFQPNS